MNTKLTPQQQARVREIVQTTPALNGLLKSGRDADILTELARPRADLPMPATLTGNDWLASAEPDDVRAMDGDQTTMHAFMGLRGSIDMPAAQKTIDAMPPALAAKLNAQRTRPGSVLENEFGGEIMVNELSDALLPLRPGGRIA